MNKAEIRRAIKSLKNGKAPGEDMITAELLKADLEFTTDRVKELINTIWSLILGRIIIERICIGIDHRLRKEQARFRSGRGTTEQIFILRNILEQVNEWQVTLYINFVDFEKAFDSVHRNGLWTIMSQYGIPQKIINIVKALYDGFE